MTSPYWFVCPSRLETMSAISMNQVSRRPVWQTTKLCPLFFLAGSHLWNLVSDWAFNLGRLCTSSLPLFSFVSKRNHSFFAGFVMLCSGVSLDIGSREIDGSVICHERDHLWSIFSRQSFFFLGADKNGSYPLSFLIISFYPSIHSKHEIISCVAS